MTAKKVKSAAKTKKPAKQDAEFSEKHERKFVRMKEDIEKGSIDSFDKLLDIMDKTPLGKALGYQGKQFQTKMDDPRKFTIGDVIKLAVLTGISEETAALLFLRHAMDWIKQQMKKSAQK